MLKTSLVTRLALVVVTIIIVATILLAYIVHRATGQQFVDIQENIPLQEPDAALQKVLADAAQAAIRESGFSRLTVERVYAWPALDGRTPQFVVVNSNLDVVLATDLVFESADVSEVESGGLLFDVAANVNGERIGLELVTADPAILTTPSGEMAARLVMLPELVDERAGREFATSIWLSAAPLLLAVVAAAVLLSVLVLRRALRPIDALTSAASQLSEGGMPGRLTVDGGSAEFQNLVATFNAATDAIANTEQLRRQFLSDIAHELRTPVTNIKGQLEAVDAGLVEFDAALLATLRAETSLLETLMSDFQELAMSDAGQLHLSPQWLPLAESVANILCPVTEAAGAALLIAVPESIEVCADEERLRQVLINLFNNAQCERPDGLMIAVRAKLQVNLVEIVFEDNGPGIAPAHQPHVFDRLYRADKSRSRTTGGAGLGLAIVRNLIDAMDGKIEYCKSEVGGAGFRIVLPAREMPPD